MKKNWGVSGTLRSGKLLAKHALDGKKHGRIEDERSYSKINAIFVLTEELYGQH